MRPSLVSELRLTNTALWRGAAVREAAALALLLLLTAWALLPSLHGEFVTDDYVFLVTSRMVDAPWQAFWQRHFYEPLYFRPVGLVAWWLTQRWFGLDYALHAAFNAALHLANVALVWLLLRRFATSIWARVAGVGSFALGPLSFPAVLWLSDRFDLLAVLFLLLVLHAALSNMRSAGLIAAVFVAALAACWSKEWAIAGCFAAMLGFAWAAWRWREPRFAFTSGALLTAMVVAWAVRVAVLDAVATSMVANAVTVSGLSAGAWAWFSAAVRLCRAAGDMVWTAIFAGSCAITLPFWIGLATGNARRKPTLWLATAAMASLAAVIAPQTVTVSSYIALIETGIFGVVSTARFFYGPMALLAILVAMLLSADELGNRVRTVATGLCSACLVAFAVNAHHAAAGFSSWTTQQIAPVAKAATLIADSVAKQSTAPCTLVFLGTELQHPYFRMFSDVTVKARSMQPDTTWRCFVMTESTPWLFAFPSNMTPAEPALRPVPFTDGMPKPDSTWSSIRYRYRFPSKNLALLADARFYDWQNGQFVDVTSEVWKGSRTVTSHDW